MFSPLWFRAWIGSVALVLLLVIGNGCDWTVGSGAPVPPLDTLQTRILDVRVRPSPIPPGDTATFTVVIADSSDPSFEYRWYLAGVGPVILSDTNTVSWTAPEQTGTASHIVVVDNGSDSLSAPSREFIVTIDGSTQ